MTARADEEEGLTPRERRALREKEKRKQRRKDPKALKESGQRIAKKAIIPAIFLLLIAAVAGAVVLNNQLEDRCPGHWHASTVVFIESEPVVFEGYSLENGNMRHRTHFHRGDYTTMHLEGGCADVERFYSEIDTDLQSDGVTISGALNEQMGRAGSWQNNETHTWRAFIAQPNAYEWEEMSWNSMRGYQPQDGDRLLLTYGNLTEEEIQEQQERMPYPPGYEPGGPLR